ncbi:MAG: hypothetical protein U5L05_00820 [Rubrivivax sp.]|nr:hypothetical protein [Rubrivivax sp.]
MNDAARLLDGDLSDHELTAMLERLRHDAAFRDEISTQQLVRDAAAGIRCLDDGYSLRILARVRQSRSGG